MLQDFYNSRANPSSALAPISTQGSTSELRDISVSDLQYIAESPIEEDPFCIYLEKYIADLEAILTKIESIKKSEKAVKLRLKSSRKLYSSLVTTYVSLQEEHHLKDPTLKESFAAPASLMADAKEVENLASEVLKDASFKELEAKVTELDEFQH